MEMTGEYEIAAPREKVWDALNDPEILAKCIPGCQELNKDSETELSATVKSKVGPVSATFKGKVTLSDIDPPSGYKISGEGTGGVAGFAKGGADVKLAANGENTVLTYVANAQVGGKLAQIGSRLIDTTAKKMANDFFGKFAEEVGRTKEEEPEKEEAIEASKIDDVSGEAAETPSEESIENKGGISPALWVGGLVAIVVVVLLVLST